MDKRIPVSSSVQLAKPTMDSHLVQKATKKPGKGERQCFEIDLLFFLPFFLLLKEAFVHFSL